MRLTNKAVFAKLCGPCQRYVDSLDLLAKRNIWISKTKSAHFRRMLSPSSVRQSSLCGTCTVTVFGPKVPR